MTGTQHHAACIVVSGYNQAEVPVYNSPHSTWFGRGQAGQNLTSASLAGIAKHVSRKHVALKALPAVQGGAVVTATVAGGGVIWVARSDCPLQQRVLHPKGSSVAVRT
jgi:hypothetical protein